MTSLEDVSGGSCDQGGFPCSIYAQPFLPCAVSIGRGFNDQHAT